MIRAGPAPVAIAATSTLGTEVEAALVGVTAGGLLLAGLLWRRRAAAADRAVADRVWLPWSEPRLWSSSLQRTGRWSRCWTGCWPPTRGSTCWWSTTAAPTGRQAGPGTGRARAPGPPDGAVGQAGPRSRLPRPGSAGSWSRATTPWSRWTPTCPTPGPAASPAGRAGHGRPGRRVPVRARGADGQLEPAPGDDLAGAATPTCGSPSACPSTTARPATGLQAGGAGGPGGGHGPLQRLLLPGRDGPQDLRQEGSWS